MPIDDFEKWLNDNCPQDRGMEEFIMRLALGTACLVEDSAPKLNMTVKQVLDQFYWNDDDINVN